MTDSHIYRHRIDLILILNKGRDEVETEHMTLLLIILLLLPMHREAKPSSNYPGVP